MRRLRVGWLVASAILLTAALAYLFLPHYAGVVIHFDYGSSDLNPLLALEDRLRTTIVAAGVGESGGYSVADDGSDGYIYLYGPDADKLLQVVRPSLRSTTILKNVEVTLVYGAFDDLDAPTRAVRLGS